MHNDKHKVLWVDDEAKLYLSYAEEFERQGLEIIFIRTIERAKFEIEDLYSNDNPPKGILLDIMMPGVDPIIISSKSYRTKNGHVAGLIFYNMWLKNFINENNSSNGHKSTIIALTNLSTPEETVNDIKKSGLIYITKSYTAITEDCINIIKKGIVYEA